MILDDDITVQQDTVENIKLYMTRQLLSVACLSDKTTSIGPTPMNTNKPNSNDSTIENPDIVNRYFIIDDNLTIVLNPNVRQVIFYRDVPEGLKFESVLGANITFYGERVDNVNVPGLEKLNGNFTVSYTNCISLDGCPKSVRKLKVEKNDKLTSLKGIPNKIHDDASITLNKSLKELDYLCETCKTLNISNNSEQLVAESQEFKKILEIKNTIIYLDSPQFIDIKQIKKRVRGLKKLTCSFVVPITTVRNNYFNRNRNKNIHDIKEYKTTSVTRSIKF